MTKQPRVQVPGCEVVRAPDLPRGSQTKLYLKGPICLDSSLAFSCSSYSSVGFTWELSVTKSHAQELSHGTLLLGKLTYS